MPYSLKGPLCKTIRTRIHRTLRRSLEGPVDFTDFTDFIDFTDFALVFQLFDFSEGFVLLIYIRTPLNHSSRESPLPKTIRKNFQRSPGAMF